MFFVLMGDSSWLSGAEVFFRIEPAGWAGLHSVWNQPAGRGPAPRGVSRRSRDPSAWTQPAERAFVCKESADEERTLGILGSGASQVALRGWWPQS
jgi:hypothetical protein